MLIPAFLSQEVMAQLRSAGAVVPLKNGEPTMATSDIAVQTDMNAETFLMSFNPLQPLDQVMNWISSRNRAACLMCMVDGESALLGPYHATHTCTETPWAEQVQTSFDDACSALGVTFERPEDRLNLYHTVLGNSLLF